MSRSTYPFLSPFDREKAGGPVANLQAGLWHREDDLLGQLATATEVNGVRHLGDVKSVAGIWAHAQTFFDLWTRERRSGHPLIKLRDGAVASWRGLLALVALSESSRLNVGLYSIGSDGTKAFLREALPSCPDRLLNIGDGATRHILETRLGYILYADNPKGPWRVAGLIAPTCLVLPARTFAVPHHPRIGWVHSPQRVGWGGSDYPLGDPSEPGLLRPKQRDALLAYVEYLTAGVDRLRRSIHINVPEHPLHPLTEALDAFTTDLTARSDRITWHYRIEQRHEDREGAGGAFRQDPGKLLNLTPRHDPSPGTREGTDFELVTRDPAATNVLIYADSFRDAPLNPDSTEGVIWRDLTVTDTTEAEIVHDLGGDDGPLTKGWKVVLGGDLFAPRLIELVGSGQGAVVYPQHGKLGNYLLPLSPAVLEVLSPNEVQSNIELCQGDGDSLVVSLRVQVREPGGELRERIIARTYERDEIVRQGAEPPRLALWPNFSADDWHDHFVYQFVGPKSFRITGAVTRASALGIDGAESPVAQPYGQAIFNNAVIAQREDIVEETVAWYRSRPEALICEAGGDTGLLLIDLRPAPPVDPQAQWRVAVDYGTTNTAVAYRLLSEPPREARALTLRDRTVLPFVDKDSVGLDDPVRLQARYAFFSPERVAPPFLTLLRSRPTQDPKQHKGAVPTVAPAVGSDQMVGGTYAIAYATDFDWLYDIFQHVGRYRFGVKWSPEPTPAVQCFLRQVTLQAAAEARAQGVALARISWSFTLPGALQDALADTYQQLSKAAVAQLTPKGGSPKVDFPLESAAALSYMVNISTSNVGITQVVLDVGGHSTDIAIYSEGGGEALWEGSVELGGRTILIDDWIDRRHWRTTRELLRTFPEIDQELENDIAVEAFDDPATLRILLEMVVNRAGIPSEDQVRERATDDAARMICRLDQRADLAFFVLCEYVMIVLARLETADVDFNPRVGLNFCGRGAKLIGRARHSFGAAQGGLNGRGDVVGLRRRFDEYATGAQSRWETLCRIESVSFSNRDDTKMEVSLGAAALSGAIDVRQARARHPLPQGELLAGVPWRKSSDVTSGTDDAAAIEPSRPIDAVEKAAVVQGLAQPRIPRAESEGQELPVFRDFLRRYAAGVTPDLWERPLPDLPTDRAPEALVAGVANQLTRGVLAARSGSAPAGYLPPLFIAAANSLLERWDDVLADDT